MRPVLPEREILERGSPVSPAQQSDRWEKYDQAVSILDLAATPLSDSMDIDGANRPRRQPAIVSVRGTPCADPASAFCQRMNRKYGIRVVCSNLADAFRSSCAHTPALSAAASEPSDRQGRGAV